ncbi:hypothetical protein ACYOEI_00130 [Singulisphaera rosea]
MKWSDLTPQHFSAFASTCSAIAAGCSAFVARELWRLHGKNIMETHRPILVLEDWTFTDTGDMAEILIGKVENVGKGPALYISHRRIKEEDELFFKPLEYDVAQTSKHTQFMCQSYNIIAPGEKKNLNGQIILHWKTIAGTKQGVTNETIKLFYWDILGNRHVLSLDLFISASGIGLAITEGGERRAWERINEHVSVTGISLKVESPKEAERDQNRRFKAKLARYRREFRKLGRKHNPELYDRFVGKYFGLWRPREKRP